MRRAIVCSGNAVAVDVINHACKRKFLYRSAAR